MHKFFPHTKTDIKEMLQVIGANSVDDLFSAIPQKLIMRSSYNIPNALSDYNLETHMSSLATSNQQLTVFRGSGAYDHYTLSIINSLVSRQEFLTSYTPYQPEVSQGTLQYIFEYQSMMCELTNMEVSNASMYDGSTATAEAMLMAYAQTKKKQILISDTVNPTIIEVVKTYAKYRNIEVIVIENKDGSTNLETVKQNMGNSMGLIVQNPNYYGSVEDLTGFADVIHSHKGLFIINSDAQSLAILKTPGEYGADIACGDLQSLGIPLSFGGPHGGYLTTRMKLVRKMPGRICGITNDTDGRRAFVLTLQAREQHIRRAKANSNICSNQSLITLAVAIYLSTLGKKGLIEVANESLKGSHYLFHKLLATNKFSKVNDLPFIKEFSLKANFNVDAFNESLLKDAILGPLHLGDGTSLFAVTEKRSIAEIDYLVQKVVEFKWNIMTK